MAAFNLAIKKTVDRREISSLYETVPSVLLFTSRKGKGVFRTQSNIYHGVFSENNYITDVWQNFEYVSENNEVQISVCICDGAF